MSKRPDFTIAQVTEQFDVSRSTLRRGLTDGRFPGARKDQAGRWVIPVDDVLQSGFKPRKTWLNEQGHEPDSAGVHEHPTHAHASSESSDHAVLSELAQMKIELAHERAQAEKLKALLEAEQEHVNSLRMALRMIEGTSSAVSQPDPPTELDQSTEPPAAVHRNPRRNPGVFSRLFRRR